jgi:hypothetical protein
MRYRARTRGAALVILSVSVWGYSRLTKNCFMVSLIRISEQNRAGLFAAAKGVRLKEGRAHGATTQIIQA